MRIFENLFGILGQAPKVYVFKSSIYHGSENGVTDIAQSGKLEVLAKQICALPGKPREITNLVDAPHSIKKAIIARYDDAIGMRYSEIKELRGSLEKCRKPEKTEAAEKTRTAAGEDIHQGRKKYNL